MRTSLFFAALFFSLAAAAYPTNYTCETSSQGYTFNESSLNSSVARQTAVADCTSNSSTNNQLCQANVYCNDGAYYPPMTQCETQSTGYNFNETSRDENLARTLAIQYCTANSSTNNSQCQANAICHDGKPVQPYVSCNTQSNGYTFTEASRDGQLARTLTISDCTSNSSTNNSQCQANVACSNTAPQPYVTCTTVSSGYNFSQASRDPNLARSEVISACTSNSSTNNQMCQANVACSDGYARPFVSCSTQSRGYSFNEASRDQSIASNLVVNDCTTNSSTDNTECSANLYCR